MTTITGDLMESPSLILATVSVTIVPRAYGAAERALAAALVNPSAATI
jgi:hypothetical protein